MRIPVTVDLNTLKTYNQQTNKLSIDNTLQSDNFENWDKNIPNSLQELCVQALAQHWTDKPILDEIQTTIDRQHLLTILPTTLPLNLTVLNINDDIYWKRCYIQKWPKLLPNMKTELKDSSMVKQNNKSRKNTKEVEKSSATCTKNWKQSFLEMYLRDYLEKVKPEEYNAEKIKELADICGDYVRKLEIRELQCSENSSNRIPLNSIVTGLKYLTELSLCFKQTYVGEDFTWNILKVSLEDVKLLAKGLKKCKLSSFRLQNSDINDEKLLIIMKSLLKQEDLRILDFSHCGISNLGAIALSKFCLQNPVTTLILRNNQIDAVGAEALCYAICKNCALSLLDLKLNPISQKGADGLMKSLALGARNIKKLFLNGCGIRNSFLIGEMIEHNSTLECLDICNNALGEEMGKALVQGLRYNTNLKILDVRMCKLNATDELEILQKIGRNRKLARTTKRTIIVEPHHDFEIDQNLKNQIETVFELNSNPSPCDSPTEEIKDQLS